jgi:hypothetical protein
MRRLLPILFALALLTGCGGADSSLFATAVRNTQAAGGAEIAFQWNYEVPGRDTPIVMTGTGLEDASGQRGRITAQLPAAVPGGGELEAVMDGLVMYMRAPFLGYQLGGKEWMKVDLARAYDSLGIDVSALGQVGQSTRQQLEALADVSDGIEDEGREQVRGVDATHYSATVDLHKVSAEGVDKLIELTGQSEFDVDVWIDDDQRIRRMEWTQNVPAAEVEMTMIMEYVRFGVPVDIDVPGDDEVFDATNLAVQGIEDELD